MSLTDLRPDGTGGGGGGGGDIDRQFYSSGITTVGLSAKAIVGQISALFGVYDVSDNLLAGFQVDGDLFAPNVISRTGLAGEFTLNDLKDDYDNTGAQKLQTYDIDTTAPLDGQVLTYDSLGSEWKPSGAIGGGATSMARYDLGSTFFPAVTGTFYTIPADTVYIEDAGYSNTAGVITVSNTGRYSINATLSIDSPTNALEKFDGEFRILVNGATVADALKVSSYFFGGDSTAVYYDNVINLTASDTVEVQFTIINFWGATYEPEFGLQTFIVIDREYEATGIIGDKQDDVITTQGDLVLGDATGEEARLPIGANNHVLTSNGTTASWQAPSGGGGSSPVTTEGDLIIGDNTGNEDRLAIGTSGQVLKSNGTTAAWSAENSNATQLQGVDVSATAPANGEVLTYNSTTTEWEAQAAGGGGGSGDVVGPASSTDNTFAVYDGTTGKLIKDFPNAAMSVNPTTGRVDFFNPTRLRTFRLGDTAQAAGDDATAIGYFSRADTRGTAIGRSSSTGGHDDCVAIGYIASCTGIRAFAMGRQAIAAATSVAIGYQANSSGVGGVSVGTGAQALDTNGVGIGNGAKAKGSKNVAIGELVDVSATSANSIAIGARSTCTHTGTVLLLSTSTAANQFAVGNGFDYPIIEARFGSNNRGFTAATYSSLGDFNMYFHDAANTSADISATDVNINSARGSGTGDGGHLVFKTAAASGTSSTTLNTLETRFELTDTGEVIQNANDAATPDAAMWAGSISMYLDETGNQIIFKAKYADGTTVKTGSVALT